jgi:hypothetical protein
MIKNDHIFICSLLIGLSASFATPVFAAPLQILEFKKGQLSQTEQTQLCEQVKDLCQQRAQWRSLKATDQS